MNRSSDIGGWTQDPGIAPDLRPTEFGHRRGRFSLAPALLCLALAALSLYPSLAEAATKHVFSSDFSGAGASNPSRMALDQANGHLYVANQGAGGGVFNFDPSGELDATTPQLTGLSLPQPSAVGVDESATSTAGDIYVGDVSLGEVFRFSPSGAYEASFSPISGSNIPEGDPGHGGIAPLGIAVNPANANVYVTDTGNGVVDEFTASGTFVRQFGLGILGEPGGLALDSSGNLYVANAYGIIKFEPSGSCGQCNSFGETGYSFAVAVDDHGDVFADEGGRISEFDPAEQLIDRFGEGHISLSLGLGVRDSTQAVYVADYFGGDVHIFSGVVVPDISIQQITNPTPHSGTLNATAGVVEAGEEITSCSFEYGPDINYGASLPCLGAGGTEVGTPTAPITSTTPVAVHAGLVGLEPETPYHYRLTVTGTHGSNMTADHTYVPHFVAGLETEGPTSLTATAATLNASFVGNGEDTHYYFEWGIGESFDQKSPVPPGNAGSPVGPARTPLSVDIKDLDPSTKYRYRVVANNTLGRSVGEVEKFSTPSSPPILAAHVTGVHSDAATLVGSLNPGGKEVSYQIEYGLEACSSHPAACTATPATTLEADVHYHPITYFFGALTPATTYYYRVVATSAAGTTATPDQSFTTHGASEALYTDPCANAHARQQTGAALLLDCRAYELVSAGNTGGYDVESSLIAGQQPLPGYPSASGGSGTSRLLYGVHDGGIPGTNHPTNRGIDPYVATRGKEGWSTEYVGIPANFAPAVEPYGSPLGEADSTLRTFAFSGSGLCQPCFSEGLEVGIPLRLPAGGLVQGMAGSLLPGGAASSAGFIGRRLSSDGSHLIFGSDAKFEPDANEGEISIYDRDLDTGQTHVVSKTPAGATMKEEGTEIGELDLSGDGSRIVVGHLVEEIEGAKFWHLYMNIGDSQQTVDMTPGTTHGVLFDGMTEDGSRVFFTTVDRLLPAEDSDNSADIYEVSVAANGTISLRLISTGPGGAPINSDSCEPVSSPSRPHWNAQGVTPSCGALAIGPSGVAAGDGTIFFLSPELLDGSEGVEDQPNLYVAKPGAAPTFVATLSPADPTVLDALAEPGVRKTADFELTSSGEYAALTTRRQLGPYDNEGFAEVYRYQVSTGTLYCVSCDPTNEAPEGDASMAPNGLSLTDDGRIFFNSSNPLVLRDLDNKVDVYEWEEDGVGTCGNPGGCTELISTGSSFFDSRLLTASADGTDVFFFTRDRLSLQDENGDLVKIYDARADGGFPYTPESPPCKASDECHGASSPLPNAPDIKSTADAGFSNVLAPESCKPRRHLKNGSCVKDKSKRHRHRHRSTHRRRGGSR